MDILDLIKNEYRQIETLFSEIESTSDTVKLYKGFNKLSEEIILHTEVKAQTFYPEIHQLGEKKELIDTALREHNEIRQMLEEIESLSPTSQEFQTQVQAAKRLFQHHIQEEEKVFSQVRQHMSEAKRRELASKFAAAKSKLASDPVVG